MADDLESAIAKYSTKSDDPANALKSTRTLDEAIALSNGRTLEDAIAESGGERTLEGAIASAGSSPIESAISTGIETAKGAATIASAALSPSALKDKAQKILFDDIPAIVKPKEEAKVIASDILNQARPQVLQPIQPTDLSWGSTIKQAFQMARNSTIPIPTEDVAKSFIGMNVPTNIAWVLGEAIPLISKFYSPGQVNKIAANVAKMGPDDAAANLASLSRELKAKSADPIEAMAIKSRLADATPMDKLLGTLATEAGEHSAASQALLGHNQITSAHKGIAQSVLKDIGNGKFLELKDGERVMDAVMRGVRNGDYGIDDAADILGATKLGKADVYGGVTSEAAKMLNLHSQIKRQLIQKFGKDSDVVKVFESVPDQEWTTLDKFMEAYKQVDAIRLAGIISHPSTAAANLISQFGRYNLDVATKALNGVIGAVTGKVPAAEALDAAKQAMLSLYHANKKSGRDEIKKILDMFPAEAAKFSTSPLGEITGLKKYTNILTALTRGQEGVYRNAAFDANLRYYMAQRGLRAQDIPAIMKGHIKIPKYSTVELQSIVHDGIKESVRHALDLTYAYRFGSHAPGRIERTAGRILDTYRDFPILTAVAETFPRYSMNAMKTLFEHSPLPLLKKETYKAMSSSDPQVAFNALNKSLLGSSLIAGGYTLDKMGYSPGKWFEVGKGKEQFDTRKYYPATASLFLGRLISRIEDMGSNAFLQITKDDWTQALMTMRRVDSTGIPILDVVAEWADPIGRKTETIKMVSSYVKSLWPRLAGDAVIDTMALFNEQDKVQKYTKINPWLDPLVSSVPFLHRTLEPAANPLAPGPVQKHGGAGRLLSFNYKIKNEIELEGDRLGITTKNLYPRTGDPMMDLLATRFMGNEIQEELYSAMNTPAYINGTFAYQRTVYDKVVSKFRSAGIKYATGKVTILDALKYKMKRKSEYAKERMAER